MILDCKVFLIDPPHTHIHTQSPNFDSFIRKENKEKMKKKEEKKEEKAVRHV